RDSQLVSQRKPIEVAELDGKVLERLCDLRVGAVAGDQRLGHDDSFLVLRRSHEALERGVQRGVPLRARSGTLMPADDATRHRGPLLEFVPQLDVGLTTRFVAAISYTAKNVHRLTAVVELGVE